MVDTTLRAGEVAVIGYNTGQSDSNGTTVDSLEFVLLAPAGSGTTIRFTDRAWVPTPLNNNLNAGTFTDAAGDGSFAFTAGTDLAAGTVVRITFSGGNASINVNGATTSVADGGFNLDQAGDAVYVYQGTDANTPTGFLSAAEIGDGNSTFNGSLVNTGLVNGVTAVSTALDSATYHGPTTEAFSHFFNGERLLENIMDSTNWVGDDADGQKALDQPNHSGPYNVAPDLNLWVGGQGGGNGLIHVGGDPAVSGQTGYNLTQLYTNHPTLLGARDVVFDTVEGKFFVAEGERILQGNITDLLGNPSTPLALTVLFTGAKPDNTLTTFGDNNIFNLELDTINNVVYFSHGSQLAKIGYNTAGQSATVLADLNVSNPAAGSNRNHIDDFDIHGGNVYLTSHRITSGQDGDQLTKNYMYRITGLDAGDGTNAFTFGNGLLSFLPFSPDDDDATNGFTWAGGEAFPQEEGTLEGVAVSADGNTLYFTTATTLYDHDGDGGFSGVGGFGTPPQLLMGGVFSYNLDPVANPNGTYTQIWQQVDDGDTNSQAISHTFGPQGLLDDIEVDPVTGMLYFLDQTGDQLGTVNPPGDEGIWRIATDGSGLTFFAPINNINAMGPSSLWLNHAPKVIGTSHFTNLSVTEPGGNPGTNSGATALVQPFFSLAVTDHETASNPTQQLAGATVWISNNFQSGSTHQDTLTINGTQSGTVNGITYNYNANTGAMKLTGATTFANYETTIALVRFNTSGDDPTAYGAATSRTISWAVSDGLNHSDPVFNTVNVAGVNDAPVNVPGPAMNFTEDTTGTAGSAGPPIVAPANAVTGIKASDPDANPSTQDISVTLSVANGTLTIRTDVVGGITAADITGGAAGATNATSIAITATQNQVNKTLEAVNGSNQPNGLVYTPNANFNGADPLTIVTNDLGLNGNDPGSSGTGTSEQDIDVKALNVADVNDAPTIGGDGGERPAAILEDVPQTNLTAQTVAQIFGGQFSDALDAQQSGANPTGTPGDTLAGIAIVSNPSGAATGQWQYWDGDSWENIGAASQSAAKTLAAATLIRFNPAPNYNGEAPTLTAHLVESIGIGLTNGGTINLSSGFDSLGSQSRASTGQVTLNQTVTAVNDAPVIARLTGDFRNFYEGDPALLLDIDGNNLITDVDSPDFDGGSLTVTITSGDAAEDVLGILAGGGITAEAIAVGNSVSYEGTVFGTFTSDGADGAPLAIAFDADATPAAVQALLARVTYLNSDTAAPTTGALSVDFVLDDGDGDANGGDPTGSATTIVTVFGINDAPTLLAGESPTLPGTDEDNASAGESVASILADAGYADVDGPSAGMAVTGLAGAGTWQYSTDGGTSWHSVGPISDASALLLSGTADLRYLPDGIDSETPTISFRGWDGTGGAATDGATRGTADTTSNGGSTGFSAEEATGSLTVTPINDAPTFAAPALTFFTAFDATNGAELWVTDGTEAGTVLLKDINPGPDGSSPRYFTPLGGKLLFDAGDATNGRELWVTDGTEAGTMLLKDIRPGTDSSSLFGFTQLGDKLLFRAADATNGSELWVTDGSAAGTMLLKDIAPGPVGSIPAEFTQLGDKLLFAAEDATNGRELWVTDGTEGGTMLLKDTAPGSASSGPAEFTQLGDKLLFRAVDATNGSELWVTDGTEAGTMLLKNIRPSAVGSTPLGFTQLGDKLLFEAEDAMNGRELWVTDGSAAGTMLLKDINTEAGNSSPFGFTQLGDKLLFQAFDGTNGTELWVTDGSAAGTMLLKDIAPGSTNSNPLGFTQLGDKLLFRAFDGTNGSELWVTDGTAAGTMLLKDIAPGAGSSSPAEFTQFGDKLLFRATDATNGAELWVTDGTAAGTMLLKDIGSGSSNPSRFAASGGGAPAYTENGAPVQVAATVTVGDVDSADYAGGTFSAEITAGSVAGDQLTIAGSATLGSGIEVIDTSVRFNGTEIGILTAGATSLSVALDADATDAAVKALSEAVRIASNSDNPTDASRTVTFTLIDGGGTDGGAGDDTTSSTRDVTFVPVNDAPVVGGSTAPRVFAEGVNGSADHIFVNNTVTLSDVDHSTLSSVTVAITANHAAAEDVLAFVNNNAATFGDIAGSYDSATGVMTLTSAGGTATLAQFQAATRAVTYDNLSEEPTQNSRTVQIRANDGDVDSNLLSFNLQVSAQNDSPSGTSSTIIINEDSVHTLTSAHFGFSDVDGDAFRAVRFGAAPTGGTLYWDADGAGAPIAITTFPTGDYLVTDIDLGKLTFVSGPNVSGDGTGSITFAVVDDGGTTGAGQNADTTPNLLNVNVTPVNDAPEGADKTIGIDEDTAHTFARADFGFSDLLDGDDLSSVLITTLPTKGTIFLSIDFGGGAVFPLPVSAAQSISVADIDAGNLIYVPVPDGFGDDYASFTFQVRDDGGTANGGIDTDAGADTITIDVAPVADDFVFTGTTGADVFNAPGGDRWTINGRDGHDMLAGANLIDTLIGGTGNDSLDGGAGTDVLRGQGGDDFYVVDDAGDRVVEWIGRGVDTVEASIDYRLGWQVENLTLAGAEAIRGTGNGFDNVLTGNSAANPLAGLGGTDRLSGGEGDDRLMGGVGTDMLTGGGGADRFHFNDGESAALMTDADRITDFTRGEDRINIARVDADGATGADDRFSFIGTDAFSGRAAGELRFELVGDDAFVEADTDGDGFADFSLWIDNMTTVQAGDFFL